MTTKKPTVKELQERLAALENAVNILSNTLHVIDATSLLALYSLIQTNNLRQPTFKSNQDIIDSGCSDAINRMLKTVALVNANENRTKTEQTEQAKNKDQHEDQVEGR